MTEGRRRQKYMCSKPPAHPISMMQRQATPNAATLVGAVSRDAWERRESCAPAEAKQG